MAIRISVRSDIKRAVAEFSAERKAVEKATYRALNRALDKAATDTGREIRKEYNVKQRAIRSALRKRRASSKSLFAKLLVEGVRLGLIEFDARWSRRMPGASVKVKVQGGRKFVPGSFIGTRRWQSWQDGAEQAHRGVFRRVGKERYPIRYLRSVSVPQAFSNKAVLAAVERVAVETFNKNLQQQLRFLTGGP